MTTTLRFPDDILRYFYWVFLKPWTLYAYIQKDIDLDVYDPSLRELWRNQQHRSAFVSLFPLSLISALLAPLLLGTIIAFTLNLFVAPIDWIRVMIGIMVAIGVGMLMSIGAASGVGLIFSTVLGIASGMVFKEAGSGEIGTLFVSAFLLAFGMAKSSITSVSGDSRRGLAGGGGFCTAIGAGAGALLAVWALGKLEFDLIVAGAIGGSLVGLFIFFVGHFHLFIYPIELFSSYLLERVAQSYAEKSDRLFRFSPVYWDEVIWFPLFGLDQHLITIGKHNRQAAQKPIADVAQSFRQQWAARNALIELTAYDVERAQNAPAIANIAEQFAWLPPTMPKDLENVLPPIRDIAAYAQAALESDTLYNKQTQLRNAITQTQRVREGLALSNNRKIAARFGRALETWEQVLGKELSGLDAREIIPNVYVAGSPLATASKMFKGRHDLFVALERELASQAEQRPTLLLFGARRSGKTSAIKQMPVRLGPDVIPVEVDLQSAAIAEDVSGLFSVIADQIKRNALTHRRVQLPSLTRDDLRADPYVVFGDWLNQVEEAVGTRWILLNLDEYEKLTEMMDAGRIDQRVLDFLRGIIQHHPHITVLLSGSHTLEDLPPIWSDYLINVRVLKIENLKEDEARELIVKPIENFPLQYEPAAVDRILAVTGCQPFLLQATCRDLVNYLNEQDRMLATQDDANHALDSVLTTGVAYFQDLWGGRDTDDDQRAVMRAIATQKDVGAFHEAALRKLVHRDILLPLPAQGEGRGEGYRFRVELVRRWVERNAQ